MKDCLHGRMYYPTAYLHVHILSWELFMTTILKTYNIHDNSQWLPSVKCKKIQIRFSNRFKHLKHGNKKQSLHTRNKSSHLRKTPAGSKIILYYSTSYLYRFTTHDQLTIYIMLNIPRTRTCDQLDGRTRTFTSCMTI